jgi:hypothetical protein
VLELGEVDVLDPAFALDLARRLRRDDAEPALHARQRRLDLQVIGGALLVGKDAAHLGGGEDVPKDHRVEGGRRRHPLLRCAVIPEAA